MKFCKPNLPENRIKLCVVGDKTVASELNSLGIDTILTPKNNYLEPNISHHADMNILYLGKGKYIGFEQILPPEFEFIHEEKPNIPDYCHSVKLNGCIIGDKIIGNPELLTDKLEHFTVIPTKQGYGKCSCMPITENAIITGDPGIAKILPEWGIDTLLISQKDIELAGYNNGFIGGCGGLISKDILMINGNAKLLKDYYKINDFCRNYNIYIHSINNETVKDFGGIVQLYELE